MRQCRTLVEQVKINDIVVFNTVIRQKHKSCIGIYALSNQYTFDSRDFFFFFSLHEHFYSIKDK